MGRTVGDDMGMKMASMSIVGKNLFSIDSANLSKGSISSIDGININTNDVLNSRVRTNNFIKVAPSTTYTMQLLSSLSKPVLLLGYKYKLDMSFIGMSVTSWSASPKSFTVDENTAYVKFDFTYNATASTEASAKIEVSELYNIQFELGSTETAYEPYTDYDIVQAKKIYQAKLNGKYIWGSKNNKKIVFKDPQTPAVPILTANSVVNVLQSNANVSSATKAYSWTPAKADITGGIWSIVSSSGFPMTLSINASTGAVTGSAPSAVDSGATSLSITLRYTVSTRHGRVSKDITCTTQRIVAPYFTLNSQPTTISIGTGIAVDIRNNNITGSITTSNLGTNGQLTFNFGQSTDKTIISYNTTDGVGGWSMRATPQYTEVDWSQTNGLAFPQSVTMTNAAGSYTKNYTVERRMFWEKINAGQQYEIREGAKVGILTAKTVALPAAGAYPFLNYFSYSLLRGTVETSSYALGNIGLSRDRDLLFKTTGLAGWYYLVSSTIPGVRSIIMSNRLASSGAATFTLIVGYALVAADTPDLVKPSSANTTYYNNAFNGNLYITG